MPLKRSPAFKGEPSPASFPDSSRLCPAFLLARSPPPTTTRDGSSLTSATGLLLAGPQSEGTCLSSHRGAQGQRLSDECHHVKCSFLTAVCGFSRVLRGKTSSAEGPKNPAVDTLESPVVGRQPIALSQPQSEATDRIPTADFEKFRAELFRNSVIL